jgi:hypothetical protein
MSADDRLIENLAREIADYLDRNSQAADDVEGIMHWWLRDQREGKTLERVQVALDLLESRGVVARSVLKDGHVIYGRALGL